MSKKWQTMDTSPRDGSRVLLYFENGTMAVAHHHYAKNTNWGYWDISDPADFENSFDLEIGPTHWRPLPKPPRAYDGDGA